jgi:hypothetical protein
MKTVKRTLGLGLMITFLASCGGHTLCDAYSYLDYKNEGNDYLEFKKQQDNPEVLKTEEIEIG